MQIDLGSTQDVLGVVTQGRAAPFEEWVPTYTVRHSSDGTAWTAVAGEFAGATDAVTNESVVRQVTSALDALRKKKGKVLTKSEEAKETKRVLDGISKTSEVPKGKDVFIAPPADRLEQARRAKDIRELCRFWDGKGSAAAGKAVPAPVADTAARISEMREARSSRPTDKVVIECVKEGSKIRARVVSAGYDESKNVQFPKAIREAGKRFVVDLVVNAGSFYRVKGNITE